MTMRAPKLSRSDRLAVDLDALLRGHKHGEIMMAFGNVLASMSLHQRADYLDESMQSIRDAADVYFARYKAKALQ